MRPTVPGIAPHYPEKASSQVQVSKKLRRVVFCALDSRMGIDCKLAGARDLHE